MTEVITSDARTVAPVIEDDPHIAEAPMHDSDGLHYWVGEGRQIIDAAFIQARALKESGAKLPSWAGSIIYGYAQMRKAGEQEDRALFLDTERLKAGKVLAGHETITDSTWSWYQRIGTTNESPELVPTFTSMIQWLDNQPRTTRRDTLRGNILQDIALRTPEPNLKGDVLRMAATVFGGIVKNEHADLADRRMASMHIQDCKHEILSLQYQLGKIGREEFYEIFERLQTESINQLEAALADPNSRLTSGELLEAASLIFLRHLYWRDRNAEKYDVRAALVREDKPKYPWPAKQNDKYPMWSFDTVLKDNESGAVSRIQLKEGYSFHQNNQRNRIYLPNVVKVVRSEIEPSRFREMVKNGIHSVKMTYRTTRELDEQLKEAMTRQIDLEALGTLEDIYQTLTVS